MKKPWIICVLLTIGYIVAYAASGWFGCDNEPANEDSSTVDGSTYISDEASTITGTIDSVEYFVDDISLTLDLAVFSKSGSNFTDLGTILSLPATSTILYQLNSSSDFTAITINAGEYIGSFQSSSGRLERSSTGGPGYWFFIGDAIDGGDADAFTLSGNSTHEIQIRVFITETGGADVGQIIIIGN